MNLKSRKAWILAVPSILALGVTMSLPRAVGGPGTQNCINTQFGCITCNDASFYCSPGGSGLPGTCFTQSGYCFNWTTVICGDAFDCETGDPDRAAL